MHSPESMTNTLRLVLFCCSMSVAHTQLPGKYPALLSVRSME